MILEAGGTDRILTQLGRLAAYAEVAVREGCAAFLF